jgi:hypothetical protein
MFLNETYTARGESVGLEIGSSEEFVSERYAVQKIPMVETNGCSKHVSMDIQKSSAGNQEAYNLKLNRYHTEVEHLHQWPDNEVGLE